MPVSVDAREQPQGYASLVMDGRELILSQGDIGDLLPTVDLRPAASGAEGIGEIDSNGRALPVYCLDHDLKQMEQLPSARRYCAVLGVSQEHVLGLLCDELRLLSPEDLRLASLPACMHSAGSPLSGLAIKGSEVVAVASAESLSQALARDQRIDE